jgi:hypothetical protein
VSGGRLAVDVDGAAQLLSWNKTGVWGEIAAGRLRSFKLGRRRLILVADLQAFAERRALIDNAPTTRRTPRRQTSKEDRSPVPFPEFDRAENSKKARVSSH